MPALAGTTPNQKKPALTRFSATLIHDLASPPGGGSLTVPLNIAWPVQARPRDARGEKDQCWLQRFFFSILRLVLVPRHYFLLHFHTFSNLFNMFTLFLTFYIVFILCNVFECF